MRNVIAIDGPSASGKGTVAARVARELGWAYLDSGALYRLTALYAREQGVTWTDEAAVAKLATDLPVVFDGERVLLNGCDVGATIRSEAIGMGASKVAALPQVREALLQRQRAFAENGGLVADGRDMGSVVFPQACLKVFLTASAQVRAARRAKQLGIACGGAEFDRILADIQARDAADTNRSTAPLRQLPDAYLLNTDHMGIEEAVNQVLDWFNRACA